MIFAAGLVIVAAATAVSAATPDLSGLSASCQTTVQSVLAGPASTCLGVSGLMGIATITANQSIVAPVNDWLTSTCAQPACTNATIDSLFSNITSGCSSDLTAAEVTNGTLTDIKEYIDQWYPVAREVACLKDSNNSNAFCITTTLKALENYISQPLSLDAFGLALAFAGTDVPKNLTCTSCVQAAYALIRPRLNDANRGTWDTFLGGQCGASYTNGTTPAGIIQSASTAPAGSSSPANGAMSLKTGVFGSAVAVLFGIAGAVTLVL
ncbi:hypothetical protein BDV93DRAFT_611476 [Ceratobasidium sp. AG-I]|nr:hypothetical protein BDV93DRAFT_611476 [Ceratobasidium sp. AG-I]